MKYTRLFSLLLLLQFPLFSEDAITYPVSGKLCTMTMGSEGKPEFSDFDYLHQASGKPKLPAILRTFLLPPNADLTTVEVTMENAEEKSLTGSYRLRSGEPYQTAMGPVESESSATRAAGDIYPKLVLVNTTGKLSNCKMVTVEINPYRQDTVGGSMTELVSGDLKITYTTDGEVEKDGVLYWVDKQLKRIAVNYEDMIGAYTLTPAAKPHLAIITTDATVAGSQSLSGFIESKEQKGFEVSVVTEGEWATGAADRSDALRNWLQQNYEEQQISYVLLIGDPVPTTGDVPMKMTLAMATPIGSDCPTDYYFAELTGDWDQNKNGWFGEGSLDLGRGGCDKYAEVAVGRIPLYDNDYATLDEILDKTVAYENAAPVDVEKRKNILLIAEPSDPYTPSYEFAELIKDEYIEQNNWDAFTIYKESYGDIVPDLSPTSVTNVTDTWNSNSFGLCVWQTHGNKKSAVKIMHSDSLKNLNSDTPTMIFQGSCLNAKPEEKNNLAYALLKSAAIGTIGATRLSLYLTGQSNPKDKKPTNQSLCYYFTRFAIEDKEPIGVILNRLKSEVDGDFRGAWLNYCDYNVYGDPTVSVFSGEDNPVSVLPQKSSVNGKVKVHSTADGVKLQLPLSENGGTVELFSVQGRKVFSTQFTKETSALTVPKNAAASGVYILSVKQKGQKSIFTAKTALR